MNDLLSAYRAAFTQCFVPIFVKDGYDTQTLLEGCHMAGINVIEYTLRRPDASVVIPTLRKENPNLTVFVGSTMDSQKIVGKMLEKHPQLMTIPETLAHDVQGIISMLPMSDETIAAYCERFIVIPSAETAGECLRQMNAGAHFIKMLGTDLEKVKLYRAAPTFDFCPIFVTGGVTPERMDVVFGSGAVLTASGFDLILRGIDHKDLTPSLVCERLLQYVQAAKAARVKAFPILSHAETLSDSEWLKRLPFYHMFS